MGKVFNIAKGRFVHYCTLPGATDSVIAVPLKASGLEAETVLEDYDDLAAILAGTNDENATMTRKTLANVSVTVNDTENKVYVDCDDWSYSAAEMNASGGAVGEMLICYKPASDSVDSAIIPMFCSVFTVTPDGNALTVTVPAGGFGYAS